jgi:hypothetical protein
MNLTCNMSYPLLHPVSSCTLPAPYYATWCLHTPYVHRVMPPTSTHTFPAPYYATWCLHTPYVHRLMPSTSSHNFSAPRYATPLPYMQCVMPPTSSQSYLHHTMLSHCSQVHACIHLFIAQYTLSITDRHIFYERLASHACLPNELVLAIIGQCLELRLSLKYRAQSIWLWFSQPSHFTVPT